MARLRAPRYGEASPMARRLAPVIAELQLDAEVALAQRGDGLLQVIFRCRRHAHLVALDRRLHFLELAFLQELDDLLRALDRNALRQLDGLFHHVAADRDELARDRKSVG